jgi:hypothetical protein
MIDADNTMLATRIAAGEAITAEDVTTVSGEALRKLFLAWGASTGRHTDRSSAALRDSSALPKLEDGAILPAGILIDGGHTRDITIVPLGDERNRIIDLSYLTPSADRPLPPLIIRNCKIDGTLKLTGSRFALISITDCDICRIDADHCRIDNHCELTRLRALASDIAGTSFAQISMVAARIDGPLDLHGSKLQAPLLAGPWGCERSADYLALSLASAEIAGQLSLNGGFEARGGVSLHQAVVHKSLLLRDARLEGFVPMERSEASHTNIEELYDPGEAPSALDLSEARITGRVLIESEFSGRVNLRDVRIDGSLELHAILNCPNHGPPQEEPYESTFVPTTILDLHSATVTGAVHLSKLSLKNPRDRDSVEAQSMRPILIDLRRLSCRAFDDNEARVWNGLGHPANWRLLLEGVTFESFDRSGLLGRSRIGDSKDAIARWTDDVALRRGMLMAFYTPLARRWKEYSTLVRIEEYSPQPFETFARAYFHDGQRPMATEVAKEQLSLRFHRAALVIKQRIRGDLAKNFGLCLIVAVTFVLIANANNIIDTPFNVANVTLLFLYLLKWWIIISAALGFVLWKSDSIILVFGWVFKKFFAFGLRPQTAMATLAACLALGVVGTVVATERGALHLVANANDRPGVRTSVGFAQSEGEEATLARHALAAVHQLSEEGCNHPSRNLIDEAIYAFDVFLPVVDLRQECAYAFEPTHGNWWRLIKSAYALIGWIVVSLTLLSLSGVLRRDIEG